MARMDSSYSWISSRLSLLASYYCYIKKVLLVLFLIFTLFPISTSFSQKVDTPQTLGIVLTSNAPFNYKDADGTTVVLGEVLKTKRFPVRGVNVWFGF